MGSFIVVICYWALFVLHLQPILATDMPRPKNVKELTDQLHRHRKTFCDECMDIARNPKRRVIRPDENPLIRWIRARLDRHSRETPADRVRVCSDANVELSQLQIADFHLTKRPTDSVMDVLHAQMGVWRLWPQFQNWHCHDHDGPSLVSVSHRPGRVPGDYLKRAKINAKDNPSRMMAVVEDVGEKMKQNPLALAQEVNGKVEKAVEEHDPDLGKLGSEAQKVVKNAGVFAGSMISQRRRMPIPVRAG